MTAPPPEQHRSAWSLAPYVPLATLEKATLREIAVTVSLAKRLWVRDQSPLLERVKGLTRPAFVHERWERGGHAAQLVEAYADSEALGSDRAFEKARAHAINALLGVRRGVESLPLETFLRIVITTPTVRNRLGTALSPARAEAFGEQKRLSEASGGRRHVRDNTSGVSAL